MMALLRDLRPLLPHPRGEGGGRSATAGRRILCCALLLLLLAGCQPRTGGTISVMSPDFFGIGENLARQLVMNHRDQALTDERLLMTTMVPLDHLDRTSDFGRVLTEALATQLFHHGAEILETRRLAELVITPRKGELMLSRRAADLADSHRATAVVAGTYTLTPRTVIINVRLLDVGSDAVLSVAGMELQRSRAVDALLRANTGEDDVALSVYEKE